MVDNDTDGLSPMTPTLTGAQTATQKASAFSWPTIAWVSILLGICYAPVLMALVQQWNNDPDMGHGFFVPIIAGYVAWQKRDQIAGKLPKANWWGLAIMIW